MLELRAQKYCCVLPDFFEERPPAPLLQSDLARPAQILAEYIDLPAGEVSIENIEIGFIVEPE